MSIRQFVVASGITLLFWPLAPLAAAAVIIIDLISLRGATKEEIDELALWKRRHRK